MHRVVALIPFVLGALATGHYLDDVRARGPILEAVAQYTIDIRRPFETEMIGYAPSADIAAQVLATAALGDALGTKRLTNLSPVERRAWLDVSLYLEEELVTAIDQQLIAIKRNPGWPLHRYFLGKLAYARDRRGMGSDVVAQRWMVPLKSAYRNAETYEHAVETLAGVILEAMRILPEEEKALLPEILATAFLDPGFVRLALDVSADVIGTEEALATVPDLPDSLEEAVRVMGKRGEIAAAAALYTRWEATEWRAREDDLAAIRTRLERGDWKGLISATATWAARHRARDFDTPEGRRQAEEVLKLWPKHMIGSWASDRRSELVRFFLDHRVDSIDAQVLEATVSALSNVPAPTRARVFLAASNLSRAESIVNSAGSEGGFEWTEYFVELAEQSLERNDIDAAKRAIDRVSPSARGECDVQIVLRRSGREIAPPDPAVTDDAGNIVDEAWSTNGMLGICIDPDAGAHLLTVEIETGGAALLEWGLNGGRRETRLSSGLERIELPLSGLTGRNVFYATTVAGERITKRTARVE